MKQLRKNFLYLRTIFSKINWNPKQLKNFNEKFNELYNMANGGLRNVGI